jgi:hypothetical protein
MWDKIDNSPWTIVVFAVMMVIAWIADRWVEKREKNDYPGPKGGQSNNN